MCGARFWTMPCGDRVVRKSMPRVRGMIAAAADTCHVAIAPLQTTLAA